MPQGTSHKTRFNTLFFLKMSCTKLGKWQLLSYSLFLCVCYIVVWFLLQFSVFVLFSFFSFYSFCRVSGPDLFSLNRFMTFEQRYTTVALIYCFRFMTVKFYIDKWSRLLAWSSMQPLFKNHHQI